MEFWFIVSMALVIICLGMLYVISKNELRMRRARQKLVQSQGETMIARGKVTELVDRLEETRKRASEEIAKLSPVPTPATQPTVKTKSSNKNSDMEAMTLIDATPSTSSDSFSCDMSMSDC